MAAAALPESWRQRRRQRPRTRASRAVAAAAVAAAVAAALGRWPLTVPPVAAAAAASCAALPPARLLPVSLERCLQRCRDTVAGDCRRVAVESASGRCALGVGVNGCGPGWVLHSLGAEAVCGFGLGRSSGANATSCAPCAPGKASHPTVGDLEGSWEGSDNQLIVEVDRGGVALLPDGKRGQFVLWHVRANPNYPGAFYMERRSELGLVDGWDYAWLEDDFVNGSVVQRLVLRRFCGAGPGRCSATALSPEGSPFFNGTFVGRRREAEVSGASSGAACAALRDTASAAGGDPCCDAATALVAAQATKASTEADVLATVDAGAAGRWENVQLVGAVWNSGPPYETLRNATPLAVSTSDPLLCAGTANGANASGGVLLAKRGVCNFLQKARTAAALGARAVLITNIEGSSMPEFLRPPAAETGAEPGVPVWMLARDPGDAVHDAVLRATSATAIIGPPQRLTLASGNLGLLCCEPVCHARSLAAGNLDMTVCSSANCSAYTSAPTPAPTASTVAPARLPGTLRPLCAPCPDGLASSESGRAACGACADGSAPGSSGTCEPCPYGYAGIGGQCAACPRGTEPDRQRARCVASTVINPRPPPSPPTAVVHTSAPSLRGEGGSGTAAEVAGSSFDWGAFFGVLACLLVIGACLYCMKRWYSSAQAGGGSGLPDFSAMFGLSSAGGGGGGGDGDETAEEPAPKGGSSAGAAAGNSSGEKAGGSTEKSSAGGSTSGAGSGAAKGAGGGGGASSKPGGSGDASGGNTAGQKVFTMGPLRVSYGKGS
eukprot:TRINITY_DN26663_c0_g1_i1.p1 TRINITY_DN26663_c0_g1~~TRINITY_DN26663_c0_g1_i1.p1  ORF type:complete len:823 (+),score=177.51 TRINITY_DN26663_c0_g1_i1:135-2471(+)